MKRMKWPLTILAIGCALLVIHHSMESQPKAEPQYPPASSLVDQEKVNRFLALLQEARNQEAKTQVFRYPSMSGYNIQLARLRLLRGTILPREYSFLIEAEKTALFLHPSFLEVLPSAAKDRIELEGAKQREGFERFLREDPYPSLPGNYRKTEQAYEAELRARGLLTPKGEEAK